LNYYFPINYALGILEENGMVNCKPLDNLTYQDVKLLPDQGELFSDPSRYWSLAES